MRPCVPETGPERCAGFVGLRSARRLAAGVPGDLATWRTRACDPIASRAFLGRHHVTWAISAAEQPDAIHAPCAPTVRSSVTRQGPMTGMEPTGGGTGSLRMRHRDSETVRQWDSGTVGRGCGCGHVGRPPSATEQPGTPKPGTSAIRLVPNPASSLSTPQLTRCLRCRRVLARVHPRVRPAPTPGRRRRWLLPISFFFFFFFSFSPLLLCSFASRVGWAGGGRHLKSFVFLSFVSWLLVAFAFVVVVLPWPFSPRPSGRIPIAFSNPIAYRGVLSRRVGFGCSGPRFLDGIPPMS